MSIDERIEQCKKDLASIQANLERLKAEKEQEERWIVAVANDNRVVLNLSALSEQAIRDLVFAAKRGFLWVSFCKSGDAGSYSSVEDGLSCYSGTTKIVL